MRTYSQILSTLLMALCLQACAGSGVASIKLGAQKLRGPESVAQDIDTEVREVPWQGEEEESRQHTLPLPGGMRQSGHNI